MMDRSKTRNWKFNLLTCWITVKLKIIKKYAYFRRKSEFFDNLFQILLLSYPFGFRRPKKKGRLSRPLRKPRHTHRERRYSITSLHSRVKCAGTLQSFWLLVVCRLTGWRQRVGSWMMLEKQTIRHVTNASQRPRKPSGYVSFSPSLFFILLSVHPIFVCQFMLAKNRLDVVWLWLICMLREKK